MTEVSSHGPVDPAARRRRSPVRHPRELRQPRGDRRRGHARRPAGRRHPKRINARHIPLGLPERVVNAAVFLAPDEASCITGADLLVDGGWLSVLPGRKETTSVNKVSTNADEAVADIPDGASLAVGGFGLSGIPEVVIRALYEQGAAGLQVVSNNCGVDGRGIDNKENRERIHQASPGRVRPDSSRISQEGLTAAATVRARSNPDTKGRTIGSRALRWCCPSSAAMVVTVCRSPRAT
jgi:hypothetical protein